MINDNKSCDFSTIIIELEAKRSTRSFSQEPRTSAAGLEDD